MRRWGGQALALPFVEGYSTTALVQRIDPVRVSDHASFARGVIAGGVVHASDLLPLPFTGRTRGS